MKRKKMESLSLVLCAVCFWFCLPFTEGFSEPETPVLPCDSPDGNCNKENIALGKAASMSAAYSGTGPASLAVDGSTSTSSSQCVHTLGTTDDQPDWWQVDLGRPYTVTDITIYHREGGYYPNPHSQRIAGVWVYVDDALCYKFPDSLSIGSERKVKDDVTCDQPIRGQVVRFSKEGYIYQKHYSFINFCEVQIWVCRLGLYGPQCGKTCNSHCQQGSCDNYDGTCDMEAENTTTATPPCDSPDGNCTTTQENTTVTPPCDSLDGNCNTTQENTTVTPPCDSLDGNCNTIGTFSDMQTTTESVPCDSPDGNCNKENIALGKAASMSAAYSGMGPASLAVDGSTSTSSSQCVHTLGTTDDQPDWWQVDLGRPYTVTDITIYHREGGDDSNPHSQRIAGVWVYVDDTLCYNFPDSLSIGNERKVKDDVTCDRPIRGQVIRFSKEGYIYKEHYSFINFCEVQIWVCRSGLFGPQCDKTCDSHCQRGSCDNYDGTCDIVNIAEGKEASMSVPFEAPGYSSGPPSLAVDGNTSTYYSSCVHTMGTTDEQPDWWQVDLGRPYTVTDITIYHREGGSDALPFTQRIAGVWVYVDETLCYKFADSYSMDKDRKERDDVTCRRPTRGQIVRFAKNGIIHAEHFSFINFCEVQIWACRPGLYGAECDHQCDCPGICDNYDGTCDDTEVSPTTNSPSCEAPDGNCNKVNIAEGKEANMSVPFEAAGYSSGPPSLAVDGNTSTYYSSCVHTLGTTDDQPDWWQVDLGRPYTVTDITIYHREGGPVSNPHSQRISGLWVYVDDALCYKFPDSLSVTRTAKERDDVTCRRPIRGRVVRFSKDGFIHAKHYSFINFCEVQIWVCRPGLYGPQCDNTCDSHCQRGSCDNYNGTCDVGCVAGYYGAECNEQCGQCKDQPVCDRHTGHCPQGCLHHYQPPQCLSAMDASSPEPDSNTTKTTSASTQSSSRPTPGFPTTRTSTLLPSSRTRNPPPSVTLTNTNTPTTTTTTAKDMNVVVVVSNGISSSSTSPQISSNPSRQRGIAGDDNNNSSSSSSSTSPQTSSNPSRQRGIAGDDNNSSSSSTSPQTSSNPSRQRGIAGDDNSNGSGSSDKKYTHGEMAGVAVSMVLLGAFLGVAVFAAYRRFFRRHGTSSDGIPFHVLRNAADPY